MDNKESITALPLLPLRGLTLFPRMLLHFDVGRDKSVKAVEAAMQDNTPVLLVAQRDLRDDAPELSDLYTVGTTAHVRQLLRLPGNNIRVLVEGESRAMIRGVLEEEPYLRVEAETVEALPAPAEETRVQAMVRQLQGAFEDYAGAAPRMSQEVMINVMAADEPGYLADYIAQSIAIRFQDKQAILEERKPLRRAELILAILVRETDVLELGQDITQRVKSQMDKNQRDYFLREQIRAIQSELGEGDEEKSEAEIYREKIERLHLSEESEKKLLKEAARLTRMQPSSPEGAVIRTYLDTCLELPWNKSTRERVDIVAARRILDHDHFGMERVKERILEFLAVKRLAPDIKGQVLCLVGPPGVGKTSVGMSIARSLNRKYTRLSLGGVRDEAEIRGHRKTYIGAMPGRIISALRTAGSKNALILLDEVDKLGNDFRGDPSAALLEVLDAEQNHSFRDHYLEIPFDLSDVLFVVTANTLDTIPRPLLDRMEVIELSSYTDEEKVQIAKRHLLPRQLKKHGLKKSVLRLPDDVLRRIIAEYTRESGVRTLERELARICRRAAKQLAEDETLTRIAVKPDTLSDFLGVPRYHREVPTASDEIGVVRGLAWTSVGGEILEVEVNVVDGSGKLELTGNLGDVMKESAKAALSYIRSRTERLGIEHDFYKKYDMHIHFPEGAVPKDGPSAGITVATALVSALSCIPARHDVAMTGEVTLRGRVLPIGGLREKTMAAFRAGIRTVIIPEENRRDLQDIDPAVREALTFITAAHMDRVLESALDFTRKPACSTGGFAAHCADMPKAEELSAAPMLPQPGPRGTPAGVPGLQ